MDMVIPLRVHVLVNSESHAGEGKTPGESEVDLLVGLSCAVWLGSMAFLGRLFSAECPIKVGADNAPSTAGCRLEPVVNNARGEEGRAKLAGRWRGRDEALIRPGAERILPRASGL